MEGQNWNNRLSLTWHEIGSIEIHPSWNMPGNWVGDGQFAMSCGETEFWSTMAVLDWCLNGINSKMVIYLWVWKCDYPLYPTLHPTNTEILLLLLKLFLPIKVEMELILQPNVSLIKDRSLRYMLGKIVIWHSMLEIWLWIDLRIDSWVDWLW